MKITFSPSSTARKQRLCDQYPGIERHFNELETRILKTPLSGTKMIIPSQGRKDIPAFALSTRTDIFSGAAKYSKELTGVYVYSEKLQTARVIQFLF
jgi:hypothetical protein